MQVHIAMVGKYTGLSDAYLSVIKSLQHACLAANRKLEIHWVEASHLEEAGRDEDLEAHKVKHTLQSCLKNCPSGHNLHAS